MSSATDSTTASAEMNDADFVTFCYQRLLGRAPDLEGESVWLQNLAAGLPREQMLLTLLGSTEFLERIAPPPPPPPPELSAEDFIDLSYQRVLGRKPDAEGAAIWTQNLAEGLPRERLMFALLASPEYRRQGNTEPYPPGHFYSALPSPEDIDAFCGQPVEEDLPGIDLHMDGQLELLEKLARYAPEIPFPDRKGSGRFYFENPSYSYGDATTLYCFLRHFRPKRVVEVGSGFSSALMLDTNDAVLDGNVNFSFVEPYPQLLYSLFRPEDRARYPVRESKLQDVDLDVFRELQAGDFLFIDSTHVAKVGSDVNRLFFHILPAINPGVFIHIHDIFWPFEYPGKWLREGRAWNEAYLLRAFLELNPSFEIVWFQDYLVHRHREAFLRAFPRSHLNVGGNIWLRRVH